MSDKLWIDNICELASLDINPIGRTMNAQINIITKLALMISVATSITNKNSASLKRTIAFISILMVLYIFMSGNKTETKTPELESSKETFEPAINIHNPINNRLLGTQPSQGFQEDFNSVKVLGCPVNSDDWLFKTPAEDDTRENMSDHALGISPEIEAALTHNIPMDPSDEFYGSNFSRQIYKIPDDQGNHANQLFRQGHGPASYCKQGSAFAHLGNPYTVYTKQCDPNNGYGQARRSGLYLETPK